MRIALPILLLAAPALCPATTFTYNDTITLIPSLITTNGSRADYTQLFSGNPVIQVQAGDVVTGTITFANGPVELTNVANTFSADLVLYLTPTSGAPSVGLQTNIQFLGLSGVLGTTNPTPTQNSGGCCLTGMYFSNGAAADFTFTGFNYTIDITSLSAGSSFALTQLSMDGSTIAIGSAATPEPASIALCAIGCGWLAWRKRRSRNSIRR